MKQSRCSLRVVQFIATQERFGTPYSFRRRIFTQLFTVVVVKLLLYLTFLPLLLVQIQVLVALLVLIFLVSSPCECSSWPLLSALLGLASLGSARRSPLGPVDPHQNH